MTGKTICGVIAARRAALTPGPGDVIPCFRLGMGLGGMEWNKRSFSVGVGVGVNRSKQPDAIQDNEDVILSFVHGSLTTGSIPSYTLKGRVPIDSHHYHDMQIVQNPGNEMMN
ncbi:hypothetical protein EX30DRAFT_391251 [Ascodesmis nigricans]|uniref:Uncharacterized protein n=1 Tax=Ascodesmis nigricans TaxID=341454 RepID=A0A4S2MP21_9PEZI|nr:hypothetical protein EX30DRAFT_391251 [Ascodesmis nigricans]